MTITPLITERTVLRGDWRLVVTADMVLQRQGANAAKVRARQPRLVVLAEKAVAQAAPLIRPLVAYGIFGIEDVQPDHVTLTNGAKLQGIGVSRKLFGAEFMIAAVATIGAEIEKQILHVTGVQPAVALALDGYGTAAVGALTVAMKQFFGELAAEAHLTTTSPLYPGTNDWELAQAQTQLFSLVDASTIGVNLNSSFLMAPAKSVSMVIGVGPTVKPAGQPCTECGASATCSHKLTEP